MLITQEKAKQKIREKTGLSIGSAMNLLRNMPRVGDGKRQKIDIRLVDKAIADANRLVTVNSAVTFSKRTLNRVREFYSQR